MTGAHTGHEAVVRGFLIKVSLHGCPDDYNVGHLTLVTLSVHEAMLRDTDVKPDELSGSNLLSLKRKRKKLYSWVFSLVPFTL